MRRLLFLLFLCFGCFKSPKNCLAFRPKPILTLQKQQLQRNNQEESEGLSGSLGSAGGSTLGTSTSTTMTTNSDDRGELRKSLFKVRTITAFVTFADSDFEGGAEVVKSKIDDTAAGLQAVKEQLEAGGYEVQTVRIATNPFPEYLLGKNYKNSNNGRIDETIVGERLQIMDDSLETHGIAFVSLGPANCPETTKICTKIVGLASGRFSTSVQLQANDSTLAKAAAQTVIDNSKLGNPEDGGLANFRFCVANLGPYVPFFPAAKADTHKDDEKGFRIRFAIGLENGGLLKDLLTNDAGQTISKILPPRPSSTQDSSIISSSFAAGFADTVLPIQTICESVVENWDGDDSSLSASLEYIGLDASFNPALDDEGSVASAVEVLKEVPMGFGGAGTIAATAAMTTAIQTRLSSKEDGFNILLTGYNGLMLPLCEDQRLAELATNGKLRMTDLLNVSSVCGVGIDTVPIPGDANVEELASLYLDVAGLAERWNKPLSCRVFPVPNKRVGDMTTFDSPFLVNSKILPIS